MRHLFTNQCLLIILIAAVVLGIPSKAQTMFEEQDGIVAVEAENFASQEKTNIRAWYVTSTTQDPGIEPDHDGSHADEASGNSYLEILPDTRVTHNDRLRNGTNFSNNPGVLGILNYKIYFNNPGKYFVWVRAYSTGTEDNGIHVGLNGEWPDSGKRMQWCNGKNQWTWESKQRTSSNHCGESRLIFLEIPSVGEHTISFSMREDGFEFDKFVLSKEYTKPQGDGPAERVFGDSAGSGDSGDNDTGGGGSGNVSITGELKKWHKVTLTFDGPNTSETATPNPFRDYRLNVKFTKGNKTYEVPGYFAADGNAANTGATSGNKWRVHFSPDEQGTWTYTVSFRQGNDVAISDNASAGNSVSFDGATGSFTIDATDKSGIDLRGKGRLNYVGERYLKFAETGEYFLKGGADSPENFLAYNEFDGTSNGGGTNYIKSWSPHKGDWKSGDPTWKGGKGKGIIGAINYLSSNGMNVFSFLTMNIDGDGRDVWMFINKDDRDRYDVSKLGQWEKVFEHADKKGMYLHFKTQETENDDLLDNGNLGPFRKLYYRELIARFSHHLALNWNLGEENSQTTGQQKDMAKYFKDRDPYEHNIVIHTFPSDKDKIYSSLIGNKSELTGVSMQAFKEKVHEETLKWVGRSKSNNKPWIVANDEQAGGKVGVAADADYNGNRGTREDNQDEIREEVLWGNLMAGGAGVEYYFGYQTGETDLTCEDYRSRENMWEYTDYALDFFGQYVPYWQMDGDDGLTETTKDFVFAKKGEIYVIYLKEGAETTTLDLGNNNKTFQVKWYDPRNGGDLKNGSVTSIQGSGKKSIGTAPNNTNKDWVVLITTDNIEPPDTEITVNVTNPSEGDKPVQGSDIVIEADASVNVGSIKKVAFYSGNDKLGEDSSAPYSYNWTGASLGNHSISVKAIADSGEEKSSSSINIQVVEKDDPTNQLPVVDIVDPLDGASFVAGEVVIVTAVASDADGKVVKVEFMVEEVKVGEDVTNTFQLEIPDLAPGTYKIRVKAIDDQDGSTLSEVITITIVEPDTKENVPPTVTLNTPIDGETKVEGQTIRIRAEASDSDGEVVKVEFYNGTTLLGEDSNSPFRYFWEDPPIGTHDITVVAVDDDGAKTTSSVSTVTVEPEVGDPGSGTNELPVVNIVNPIDGASFVAGEVVIVTAVASDADGKVVKVEFMVEEVKVGEDVTNTFQLEIPDLAPGTYKIRVKAIDDQDGSTLSEVITITIVEPDTKENVPPTVTLNTPIDGETKVEGQTIRIRAEASDSDGEVVKVEFYNGTTLLGEDSNSPFRYFWEDPPIGTHDITVVAVDDDGAKTTSSVSTVTVEPEVEDPGSGTNELPVVNIVNPLDGSSFVVGEVVPVTAVASDADGTIAKVVFLLNGDEVGEDDTNSYRWEFSGLSAGVHKLKAKAIDNEGGITVSPIVEINVLESGDSDFAVTGMALIDAKTDLPISDFNPLLDGDVLDLKKLPKKLNIQAFAESSSVKSVVFSFDGNPKYRTENFAPYAIGGDREGNYFDWKVTPGVYTITATPYDKSDGKGQAGKSLTITIEIIDNELPVVNIVNPLDGSSFVVGEVVPVTAVASDADGTIAKVVFLLNGDEVGEDDTNSYRWEFSGLSAGVHKLKAKAIDNEGGITVSPIVEINVLESGDSDFAVTGMALIDAKTDLPISDFNPLLDGDVLDLKKLPKKLNIQAFAESSSVKSVVFSFDGNPKYRTENFAPYAIGGDREGNYFDWKVTPGVYTITATPYDKSDGKGQAGKSLTITIEIVDGVSTSSFDSKKESPAHVIFPNPNQGVFQLEFDQKLIDIQKGGSIMIFDSFGKIIYDQQYTSFKAIEEFSLSIIKSEIFQMIIEPNSGDVSRLGIYIVF